MILKLAAGFALLIVGGLLALPGIPGPGIAIAIAGLALLSSHFTWARRAMVWLKRKARRFKSKFRAK